MNKTISDHSAAWLLLCVEYFCILVGLTGLSTVKQWGIVLRLQILPE